MSTKTTLAAGTSPFAHLLGGAAALAGRALGKKAEDDTPIDEDGPTDEDQVVDEVDEQIDDIEDDSNGDGKGKGKGKNAKGKNAEDDSPDGDDDMDEKEKAAFDRGVARGSARENKRCSQIFLSPAAAGRADLAATLAFTTRNSSAEAVRIMGAVGSAPEPYRRASLDDRMAARTDARPGSGASGGKATFSERMKAAKLKAGVA